MTWVVGDGAGVRVGWGLGWGHPRVLLGDPWEPAGIAMGGQAGTRLGVCTLPTWLLPSPCLYHSFPSIDAVILVTDTQQLTMTCSTPRPAIAGDIVVQQLLVAVAGTTTHCKLPWDCNTFTCNC